MQPTHIFRPAVLTLSDLVAADHPDFLLENFGPKSPFRDDDLFQRIQDTFAMIAMGAVQCSLMPAKLAEKARATHNKAAREAIASLARNQPSLTICAGCHRLALSGIDCPSCGHDEDEDDDA